MTSYGGYVRTGYSAHGGEDGGGFMSASQQQSSSQTGDKKTEHKTIRPFTIKQIISCKEPYPGAEPVIDGVPVQQLTIVGQVRSVNAQSIHVTYRIDDGTGMIDARKYNADGDDGVRFEPDTFVRVFGRLATFSGKRLISIASIRAIDDFNEVNYHLLEATYVHLLLTKGAPTTGRELQHGGGNNTGMDTGGDSMFVENDYGGAYKSAPPHGVLASCSAKAQTVYKYLASKADEPSHITQVKAGTGLSERDILAAAAELLDNGMIYTTDDDETWAVLDM